jgi:Major Facilitator Superfamily.
MMQLYSLSYVHLGIIVGINFATQVAADIIFSGIIDRVGFKRLVLPCTVIAFAGLVLFGMTPYIFPHSVFTGVVISTIIFSFSSGLLEVLLSPIIDAIPNTHKGPAMSLMHSFYAWGQVATIIITTLFLYIFGNGLWNLIALLWAIVPLTAFAMFSFSPFPPNKPVARESSHVRRQMFSPAYIAAIFAIMFGGASEVVMNQWSSTFAERALDMPKLTGDLLGMCGFAVMLGLGRLIYGMSGSKLNLQRVMLCSAAASILCYAIVALAPWPAVSLAACAICGLATSLLWPGTLVLTSEHFPGAGAWLFAILAAAGDIGAAAGSALTGVAVDTARLVAVDHIAIRIGLGFAIIFPAGALIAQLALRKGRSGGSVERQ